MRITTNLSKQIKTVFKDQMDEFESYYDDEEPVVNFLSILMLLNDIFIRFQEIYA